MSLFDFYFPTRVRFGWGRVGGLPEAVKELGGQRVFLVTGKVSARSSGSLDKVTELLKPAEVILFDRVEENPTIATVDEGARLCREANSNLVIGLGGGSALDAAKAIGMLQANQGSIRDYLEQKRTCREKGLPFIAITTTSGTGSEVTPFAVITHPENRAKPAVAPVQMFPDLAIVDPELTASMPPSVTASSGLDALCQAVEGFWSTRASEATRAFSGRGIVLAMRNLEKAVNDKDRESVSGMALASNLTGIQMSQIGNTAIHPLSYPFTMDFHLAHGFACALFLPSFLRFNAEATQGIFKDVLAQLGLARVEDLADEVDSLMDRVGAPKRLGPLGAAESYLPEAVKRGTGGSTAWNPKPLSEEDLLSICRGLL